MNYHHWLAGLHRRTKTTFCRHGGRFSQADRCPVRLVQMVYRTSAPVIKRHGAVAVYRQWPHQQRQMVTVISLTTQINVFMKDCCLKSAVMLRRNLHVPTQMRLTGSLRFNSLVCHSFVHTDSQKSPYSSLARPSLLGFKRWADHQSDLLIRMLKSTATALCFMYGVCGTEPYQASNKIFTNEPLRATGGPAGLSAVCGACQLDSSVSDLHRTRRLYTRHCHFYSGRLSIYKSHRGKYDWQLRD
ncbi:hypothetical protein CEXT_452741 [Caerostris extrusa]|uniref:Uncharacterized protein n=1 Tax=Caerostris extrusa TaxID=172846 RepID=A0AAV4RN89_CAEEX|nr:hypothetical protein CEXT_452741 [Caerostris extrusa]